MIRLLLLLFIDRLNEFGLKFSGILNLIFRWLPVYLEIPFCLSTHVCCVKHRTQHPTQHTCSFHHWLAYRPPLHIIYIHSYQHTHSCARTRSRHHTPLSQCVILSTVHTRSAQFEIVKHMRLALSCPMHLTTIMHCIYGNTYIRRAHCTDLMARVKARKIECQTIYTCVCVCVCMRLRWWKRERERRGESVNK